MSSPPAGRGRRGGRSCSPIWLASIVVPAPTDSWHARDVRPVRARVRAITLLAAVSVLASAWLLATADPDLSRAERAVFEFVNGLPDGLRPPLFTIMQLGASWMIPVVAAALVLLGRPAAALRVLAAGYVAWAGANLVKTIVERGRPIAFVEDLSIRESGIDGFGFVSGHTAVAVALASVVAASLRGRWRPVPFAFATIVGFARIYVGAHLPLDVIGGAALGIACGCVALTRSGGPDPRARVGSRT
jgi:undecaprenyl-diphosphatase